MGYPHIMDMWFYDFENILKTYQKILEMRKEAEEKESKANGYTPENFNPNTMMKNASKQLGGGMPKMPSMPNLKM